MATTRAPCRNLLDLPADIFNPILELVVINRDRKTGEKRPIRTRTYQVYTRRHLRAMLACRKLHTIMKPMYFGQNEFEFIQRFEQDHQKPKLDCFTSRTGLQAVRYNHAQRSAVDSCMRMILPPPATLALLKNVDIIITIDTSCLTLEGAEHTADLLTVTKQLSTLHFPRLDRLKVILAFPLLQKRIRWMLPDERTVAAEILREAVQGFLENNPPNAEEVIVEYPVGFRVGDPWP
ncbi:hypothetical protein PRZ48_008956 [Zasmidium cellare]|uniref:Uncharacterized protein n=1 Tax=Zasmidium cellare TaxID=395010 RepID=A0ABR0EHP9_ZASCE|nr:hypothetical protein PRZ48_008956 [Zasmidium cellare]